MEMYFHNDRALTSNEVELIEELAQSTADEYCFNVAFEDHSISDNNEYVLVITSATGYGQDIELDGMIEFLQAIRRDLRRALKDMNDWYIAFEIG